ncbi:MAG: HAMP domain-containing histidine kinase [Chloroflexi bacterium]|nr:HAMP domain-containing histidine kinase [Chloroflexota bacterium]
MFKTLRARLLASYVLVVFVCLVLATVFGILWLNRYTEWVLRGVSPGGVARRWQEWLLPLLGTGALALAISTLASYVLSRTITRPVEAIMRAAQQMADGRRGPEIEVQRDDEIGRLARSFNRMASQVDQASRMQRDLVINISHDLQTPLTSIRGFSQAIVDGSLRDVHGLRRAGKIIYEEATRMGQMVDALLDLAKLEGGQIEMAKAPVDLRNLLTSCVARFAHQAAAADLQLQLEVPEALPTIQGDPDRLEQAFANLLENAIKYTPAGGRVLVNGYATAGQRKPGEPAPRDPHSVSEWHLGNGRWVVVTVADTGVGIPEEDLDRVFERFYRADKARSSQDGAGLGLAIVREIVQAHGGAVTAASHKGQGSQFTVALPVG